VLEIKSRGLWMLKCSTTNLHPWLNIQFLNGLQLINSIIENFENANLMVRIQFDQALVAHTCNPNYSGSRDQKDCSSKPTWANNWPISKILNMKRG
jgi:hypothetical protein